MFSTNPDDTIPLPLKHFALNYFAYFVLNPMNSTNSSNPIILSSIILLRERKAQDMENISIDEFEKKLRNVFTRVADNQEPVSVIMDEGREIILVDGAEYRSVMETFCLLRSPANAERLRTGIQQHKEGKKRTIDVTAYLP